MIKKIINSQSTTIGLAIFSMFFGAGNIIFPLAVGQVAGNQNFYAVAGLILTAAILPIAGVIAMILFDGNYREFFGRLGRVPGFFVGLMTISLLGPFGSAPRCIALAYTGLKNSFADVSLTLFSAISCVIIFLFSVQKTRILTLLGWVLTPVLLISLLAIIVMGLMTTPAVPNVSQATGNLFMHGLQEGYNTLDLLAAFFFSSSILAALKMQSCSQEIKMPTPMRTAFYASIIGACLLAIVYIGFSYLAAIHGNQLHQVEKDQLLSSLTLRFAGENAGLLVCVTIALACLTTAIALMSAFADYIQKEIFNEKISYEWVLLLSLLLTFFISTFEFTGISTYLSPILLIVYPGLIVLTFLNIAYALVQFKPIKIPVFCAFILSFLLYWMG